jgi:hypothetical protein
MVTQSSASTIRVNGAVGSDASGCGTTTQPCKTIQYAVNLAVSGDTILVAGGAYNSATTCLSTTVVVCILNKQLTILGGYSSDWSTVDPQIYLTVIDGQNVRRGVWVQRTDSTAPVASLRMEGFTIKNGLSQGASSGSDVDITAFGGGMFANTSTIVLRNMIFSNNKAIGGNTSQTHGGSAGGGGLALHAAPSGTLLERVTFDGNQAIGGAGSVCGGYAIGGGLYTYQSIVTGQYITATNNIAVAGSTNGNGTCADGAMGDALGGGIGLSVGSGLTLQYVRAMNNVAMGGDAPNGDAGGGFGGGVCADIAALTLVDSDVRNNQAKGGNGLNPGTHASLGVGGGIQADDANVTLNRVSVISNTATGGNGTQYTGASGGGGAYLVRTSGSSTVTVINSIFADNLAAMGATGTMLGGGGGGLWLQGVQADITHSTFARNRLGSSSMQGLGIAILDFGPQVTSVVNFSYSIIADHTGYAGVAALAVTSGNTANLERTLWAGNLLNTNSGSQSGTITDSDPIFSSSAGFISPGSPHYDYHIALTSAAKDQATGSSTSVDIDNEPRTFAGDPVPDVGADEQAPFALSVSPVTTHVLRLDWKAPFTVDHYGVLVSCAPGANPPAQGACGSPIYAGGQTTFMLSGLTSLAPYTVTIQARDSSNTLIGTSRTVTVVMPDHFIYLPVILR